MHITVKISQRPHSHNPRQRTMLLSRLSRRLQSSKTTTARFCLPDDANPAGFVHGGTILRALEECGYIATSRYVSKVKTNQTRPTVGLARVDRVDFRNPVSIGEVLEMEAKLTFAFKHSMEVSVDVFSENLQTGVRKKTNAARLWYVLVEDQLTSNAVAWMADSTKAMPPKLKVSSLEVPPLKYESTTEQAAALARYQAQKQARTAKTGLEAITNNIRRPGALPVLTHLVLPSECYATRTIFGGVLMKLMDSAAGITAVRFCGTNCVTASLEALNMESPVYVGDVVRIYAHPTFTSQRSLEVAVYVESEDIVSGMSWRAVSAHFTFVSLKEGKVAPVPQLVARTHEERFDFERGAERYRLRKQAWRD